MSSSEQERLLELPFDQYQRYRVAADLVALLEVRGTAGDRRRRRARLRGIVLARP